MMVAIIFCFLAFFSPLLPSFAFAACSISIHDKPALTDSFKHFQYVNPKAPKGGKLRLGMAGSFDNFNPFTVKGTVPYGLDGQAGSGFIYQSLMARSWDEPFSLYCLIADSIVVPEDRSFAEFTINPKAKWNDGKPITADDVLFSWEILRTQGRPNHRTYYKRVSRLEKLSANRIRFAFKPTADGSSDRELPLIIGIMPILPKHWWSNRKLSETSLQPPLGSGPYTVANMEAGRTISYEKAKDWWAKDIPAMVGQFNFDTVQVDYYRDTGVLLEAFKAGAFDLIREPDAVRWKTSYEVTADKQAKLVREVIPHKRPEWVKAFIFNTRRPLFANRKVREAFVHAFDFEWVNKSLFSNAFKRIKSFFPNSALAAKDKPSEEENRVLLAYRDELPGEVFTNDIKLPTTRGDGYGSLRHNLSKAFELLKKAGWKIRNGIMRNGDEKQFHFEILLNSPSDEKLALEFSRSLERLGITTDIKTVDSAQYQQRLANFDFDMTLNQWINTLAPGSEQLTFWGSEFADIKGSRNYPGIRSKVIDKLASMITKAKTRLELLYLVKSLDRVLFWGHYVIPLHYAPGDRVAYWKGLQHPKYAPLYGLLLETWWVEKPE